MSGGGRSTEPIDAVGAVARCEVALGFSWPSGDVEGTVSHRAILDQGPSGGGPTGCAACVWVFDKSLSKADQLVRLSPGISVPPTSAPAIRDNLGGCETPTRLKCVNCGLTMHVRCRATRDDKCGPCAKRHGKDVARVMRSGFDGSFNGDRPSGYFFITLTAPGADVLPWDTSICGHGPGECSGKNGCVCERYTVARWNETAPQRWSWFVTEMRRILKRDVQFAGSWETQGRGALHRHFLLWAAGVSERRMRAAVRLCAARWGFGRQLDVQAIHGLDAREVAIKAGYIAKYATKGGDLAVSLDVATGEIQQGGYRRWSASRHWGQTMRCVREDRAIWVRCQRGESQASDTGEARAGTGAGAAGDGLELEGEIYAASDLLVRFLGAVWV